jgi:hypothetical protein
MTADDFETHIRGLGFAVEIIADANGQRYSVVRDFELPNGSLKGRRCDVAIQRVETIPYVPPSAIHVRPLLVPMDPSDPLKTSASALGEDWQYWSRRFDHLPSPKNLWTHILTVLCDDRWPTN